MFIVSLENTKLAYFVAERVGADDTFHGTYRDRMAQIVNSVACVPVELMTLLEHGIQSRHNSLPTRTNGWLIYAFNQSTYLHPIKGIFHPLFLFAC